MFRMAEFKFLGLILLFLYINDIITSVDGVTELPQSKQQRTPNKLADDLIKCGIKNESDIFVRPLTTMNDPLRILVTTDAVDQIIARIFGLVCHVMGYQRVEYVPWRSQFDLETIERGGEGNALIRRRGINFDILVALTARYLPDNHADFDHIVNLGHVAPSGSFGLFRVPKGKKEERLTYRLLQERGQSTTHQLLNILDRIKSVSHYKNKELCPDRTSCSTIIAPKIMKFIKEYIDKYRLRTQVFWIGDEFKETIKNLITNTNDEFFVLHWIPSDISHVMLKNNATLIQMPRCTDAWESNATHVQKCMFDPIPQVKYIDKILEKDSLLHNYLRDRFHFTSEQYLSIIEDYEHQNLSIEDFACAWLKQHPEFYNFYDASDYTIDIAVLAPNLPGSENPITEAANKARSFIETQKWLRELRIRTPAEIDFDINTPVQAMISIERFIKSGLRLLLGPSRFSEQKSAIDAAVTHDLPIITYLPAITLDHEDYKNVFHTVGHNTIYVNITVSMMERYGWNQVAVLTEAGLSNIKYVAEMKTQFSQRGYRLSEHSIKDDKDIDASLDAVYNADMKIIFIDVRPEMFLKVINFASNKSMLPSDNFVWITPVNMYEVGATPSNDSSKLNGIFTIVPSPYGPLNSTLSFHNNKTVNDWKTEFEGLNVSASHVNYAGFVYDTIIAIGKVFQEIEKNYVHLLAHIGMSNLTDVFGDLFRHIDFNGVTGRMMFDKTGTRTTDFVIWEWNETGSYTEVGVFDHLRNMLKMNKNDLPGDRSYCAFGIPCKELPVLICVFIAALLIITLPLLMYFYMRDKISKTVQEYGLSHLERSPSDVEIGEELGSGHYARVYLGTFRYNDKEFIVAIKQLKRRQMHHIREFLYEADILKRLNNENIVKLRGILFDHSKIHILTDYVENGSLYNFLRESKPLFYTNRMHPQISPLRLTKFADDVAIALIYLKQHNIVHCDIAARNVLLSGERGGRNHAILSDFGLSIDVKHSIDYRPRDNHMYADRPVRYTSPEFSARTVSFACDIWSFGILLYEIATLGGKPYYNVSDDDMRDYLRNGGNLELPIDITPELESLIQKCLHRDPQQRPSAEDIHNIFKSSPTLVTPCTDPDPNQEAALSSSDTNASDSGGNTIDYSQIASSDYSDMNAGRAINNDVPAGDYTRIDDMLNENYHASNSSTSPLIQQEAQQGCDYLQMNHLPNNQDRDTRRT